MLITLDSSVIVAALRVQEQSHQQCLRLLKRTEEGQHTAIMPYTVLVEVAAAVKRRTGSEELARRVTRDLQSISSLRFVELDAERANQSAGLAIASGLRGMDAVVVQVAREFEAGLVSLDEELVHKARSVATVINIEELA